MLIRRAIALILISAFLIQCQKDISYVGGSDPVPVLPDPITASLQGTILNESGQPMSAVIVNAGGQTATTDARGYFRFTNASLDKKAALVTAEATGYFKAYRTFSATTGTNNVLIKLLPKTLAGTVDAAAGGTVTLTNGAKILLPANAIVKKSDNSNYSGTVQVYAAYIDPTAPDIDQVIPGSLMANDRNGGRVSLTSYGMMAVELESPAAGRLQVKTGETATLTTPIPSSLLTSAPTSIALWHVDETSGVWKEDGMATRQGNVYVGAVKHFSFWNCDVSNTAIQLSMTLKNNDGTPLRGARVRLVRTSSNNGQAYGYTDSLGQVSGLVPANEVLTLQVLDQCNAPFYSQNVGPFTQATNLGVITLTPAASGHVVTVSGQLRNCSNAPVTNGFVRVYYGYHTAYGSVNATGNFSVNFTSCSSSPATVDVLGVDNAAVQQGTSNNVPVVLPVTQVTVTACGTSAAQFINYTLNGTNFSLGAGPTDSLVAFTSQAGSTNQFFTTINGFQGNAAANMIRFSASHSAQVPGTYPMSELRIQTFTQTVLGGASSVTFTSFPTVGGGFYEGTFNATFSPGTNTLTGSFRIRRY